MSEERLTASLAAVLRRARGERHWSVAELARRAGVSRSMIAKIEREEAQPTAALLGRLSGALGMTLTELVASAEDSGEWERPRMSRRREQPTWTDPATGYQRRAVSPPSAGEVQLVEVELPPGAVVSYPADTYRFTEHQIWVLGGALHFVEGETVHVLARGDCLRLGPPLDCSYANHTTSPVRYLVVVSLRARRPHDGGVATRR